MTALTNKTASSVRVVVLSIMDDYYENSPIVEEDILDDDIEDDEEDCSRSGY